MGVSKFTQPNHTTKASDQAGFEAYCGEIESGLPVLKEVLGQFAPYASSPVDMKVWVAAGRVAHGLGSGEIGASRSWSKYAIPGTSGSATRGANFSNSAVAIVLHSVASSSAYRTADGANWDTVTLPYTKAWRAGCRIGARLLVVGEDKAAYSDDDGDSFTGVSVPAPTSTTWAFVEAYNGKAVAVRSTLTNKVVYSSDSGASWTEATLPAVIIATALFVVAGKFIIRTGSACYSSTDGATWSTETYESVVANPVIISSGTKAVALEGVGSTSDDVAEALDGIDWTIYAGRFVTSGIRSGAYLPDQWFAVDVAGQVYVSSDGKSWYMESVIPESGLGFYLLFLVACDGFVTVIAPTYGYAFTKAIPLEPIYSGEAQGAAVASVAAQQTPTLTAPTAAPRIDRIGIDPLSGTLMVFTGTESALPAPPAYQNDVLPICQVRLAVGQTVITNAHITDERGIVNAASPQAFEIERSDSPNVIPIMTSNTAPSGVASASSEYSAVYPAWKAFDKSPDGWQTTAGTSGWLAYEFAAPRTVIAYELTAFGSVPTRSPKTWTFEGWDGSGWIVLDTQTNAPAWSAGERRLYEISNSTAYIKYRLNVTASGDGTYVLLAEMSMRVADTLDKAPAAFDDFAYYALLTEPGLYHIPAPPAARLWRITAVGARGGRGGGYLNGSSVMTAGGGGKGPGACLPNLLWAAEDLIVVVGEAGQDGADSTPGVNNAAAGLPGENTEIIGAVSGIKATLDSGGGGAAGTSAPAGGAAGAVGSAPAAPFNVGFAGTIGTAGTTGAPGAYGNSGTCGELAQLGVTDAFVLLEWC